MNTIKKIIKSILLVLISVTLVLPTINTNAVAATIELGNAEPIPGYVAGTYFSTKTMKDGTLVYCLNINKGTAKNITAKLVGEKDAGLAYIMQNGYPNKTFTGDRQKDYYITQTAVWWYLDNTTGSSNLSHAFKTNGKDEYNLRPIISNLVSKAEAAKKAGYPVTNLELTAADSSMTLKDNYYVSSAISAKKHNNITTFNVSVSGAKNAVVVDANGNTKTTFNATDKFYVKVPASSVTSTELNITVTATATGVVYKAYEYQPVNQKMQSVVPSVLEKETTNVKSSVKLEISSSKVSIVKVDSKTGNSIAGATLVLKDSNGKELLTWTSSTNYRTFRNLKNGTYTVTEIKAPEGYILNTKPIKFTISDSNKDLKIKIENEPRKSVVNILKVDKETGAPLAGAILRLKDSNGKEYTFTTTEEPKVFTDLANGTYTVEEIEAPKGYIKSTEVITFTITDQNLSHQIIFNNYKEVEVPNTNTSSIIITLLGIVIIASGITLVYKNAKK